MKHTNPVYAQCHICYKKYDMVKYGVSCPSCKDKTVRKSDSIAIARRI